MKSVNTKQLPTELGTVALFPHQKKAIDFALHNDGCAAIFYEMGLGKTLIGLNAFKELRSKDERLILLVFCPLSLIEGAWGEDIEKFTQYTWTNGHKKHKSPQYTDIYVYNYESLLSKKKYSEIINLIKKNRCMCVLDESSRIKSHTAATTKKLLLIRDLFKHRIIMSGTPAPNNELEYWAQMNFVGDVFTKSFYEYRNRYFHLRRGNQVISNVGYNAGTLFRQGFKYDISEHNKSVLMNIIKRKAIFAKKRDCLDLPEQLNERRIIQMGASQKKIYNQMKNDMLTEINDHEVVAQTALTKLMKLRQITGGFAISDGEGLPLDENPKFAELLTTLEEVGDNQAIIWCQFRWEVAMMMKHFGERGIDLYGGTVDKDASIRAFKNGCKQYLIAHPKSAGYGLTFNNCLYQIFYSLDYSWESFEQSKSRNHRAGQTQSTTNIYLLADNTIDMNIMKALEKKQSNDELLYSLLNS